jgi:hypothetical protein
MRARSKALWRALSPERRDKFVTQAGDFNALGAILRAPRRCCDKPKRAHYRTAIKRIDEDELRKLENV